MKLKLIAGSANPILAQEISKKLGVELSAAKIGHFSDGEIQVKIIDNVRGADCYILQPTCSPVNENIMELLIVADALKRASAKRITAVMPYYGYARQDRKSEPRVPITSKLIANLITASGINRILTMDLHAGQIQGFFDIPVDHLYGTPVLLKYFEERKLDNPIVVSPDAGGVERARAFAKHLNADLAIVDKRRPRPNEAAIMNIIGDVRGRNAIILDDMIDTAGTLTKVAEAIKNAGATTVFAASSHGVLSGEALEKIQNSCLQEVVITDSIPHSGENKKIKVLSIASLLAEAIMRISNDESISALFV
ncbi:MAG: ribose-phosphate pyrophosphokinase [Endomicrobiia bacterium]|nr:ribose-phosphate pyrophosphokinase [Endomicrobiaceae bacterium]MDD3922692.1 ribose-phosphate pyrophosphokinase [Endomicrobiaceae bacterium]MDD5102514.1 ribose-phosphate pyrophosphokinase [Endomicrobiaceae bacterium]